MPEYEDRFNERIREAIALITGAEGIPEEVTAQQRDALAETIAAILAEGQAAESLTAETATLIGNTVRSSLVDYGGRLVRITEETVGKAAANMAEAHDEAIARAARVASKEAPAAQFNPGQVADEVREQMMIRRGLGQKYGADSYSATLRTLTSRNLEGLGPAVDDFLDQAVKRGIDPGKASKELATLLADGDEKMRQAINEVSDEVVQRGAWDELYEEATDLDVDTQRLRSLLSDSRMVTITEANSANDEANRLSAMRNPIVKALEWETSGRHAALASSPDVCDYYENADIHDMGPGIYPPELKPALPHPHCSCRASTVVRSPSEWDDPQPDVQPRSVRGEDLEADMRRVMEREATNLRQQNEALEDQAPIRKITDNYVKNQTRMAREKLEAAETAYQQFTN